MAFRNIFTTLAPTTATQLVVAQAGDVEVWINADTTGEYMLGGDSSVGLSSGLRYSGNSGNTFRTKVRPGDELWAIAQNSIGINIMVRSA